MNIKRILLIVSFVLSVIVFGWLLYIVFFKTPKPTPPLGVGNLNVSLPRPVNGNISVIGNRNQQPRLPAFGNAIDLTAPTDIARGGLTKVTDYGDAGVQDFVSGPSGVLFYDKRASQFYKLEGSKIVTLSDQKFYNVDKVTWSRGLDKAVLEYPDGSNAIYDFKNNKQVTLPKELTDFSFDATGSLIAGKWFGETNDENWLMVGNADGSGFRLIEPLGDRGHNVQVDLSPNNQVVALVRKPADADLQTITPIGLRGENFSAFNVPGLKFESKWSPTGNALLYNVATAKDDYNPSLWITTGTTETLGNSHLDLKLNTWASKCSFDSSGNSIYCAEPTSLPRGAGLYPELAQGVADAFYRIDLRSGQKIPLALPVGNQIAYSAASVFLSTDESQLYFVEATTGRLHSIRLK